jgi:hypothetical protein
MRMSDPAMPFLTLNSGEITTHKYELKRNRSLDAADWTQSIHAKTAQR